uniref:PRELI domain containing 1 n=1 Tax=Oncorhynchus kisutch TaxID=8019 RepID=A0A8C7IC04_ONCKI
MVKYFSNDVDIRTTWDHVVSAFWQRYPNPFSTHVLTEDVVLREVTADQRLLSRRLLTKTNRMPRWAEFLFPSNLSRSVYIVEDSVVDPVTKSLTTYTWNLNHTTLMVRYTPTYAPLQHNEYTVSQRNSFMLIPTTFPLYIICDISYKKNCNISAVWLDIGSDW